MTTANHQLQLLGGFRMVNEGCTLAVPVTAAKLLAMLALHERPIPRSRVAGEFWPELSERRAASNLRTTVWRLPNVSRKFLTTTGTTIATADAVEVDLQIRPLLGSARLPGGTATYLKTRLGGEHRHRRCRLCLRRLPLRRGACHQRPRALAALNLRSLTATVRLRAAQLSPRL